MDKFYEEVPNFKKIVIEYLALASFTGYWVDYNARGAVRQVDVEKTIDRFLNKFPKYKDEIRKQLDELELTVHDRGDGFVSYALDLQKSMWDIIQVYERSLKRQESQEQKDSTESS